MFKNFSHKASLVAKNELKKIRFLKKMMKISWNMGVVTTWSRSPNENLIHILMHIPNDRLKGTWPGIALSWKMWKRKDPPFFGFSKISLQKKVHFHCRCSFWQVHYSEFLTAASERTVDLLPALIAIKSPNRPQQYLKNAFLKEKSWFEKSRPTKKMPLKNSQLDDVIEWWWRHRRKFLYSLMHAPNDCLSYKWSTVAVSQKMWKKHGKV